MIGHRAEITCPNLGEGQPFGFQPFIVRANALAREAMAD
jgi:hypothetical protein